MSLPPTNAEIRQANLKHEASVQSIGLLYYLASALFLLSVSAGFFSPATTSNPVRWPMTILFALLAGVYFQVGRWFRALNPNAKIPGTILAAIGLLAFPVGTLVNLYVLYLINSAKGRTVFSEEYRAVITATPEIKYKTPLLVWIFLGLLALILIAVASTTLFSVRRP